MFLSPQDRVFQIEVTTQCNLKCAGCFRTVSVANGKWESRHIDVEVFRTAIEQTRPAQAIILQGIGEPTLHPHLPELIKIAHDSGKFQTISFYTNGLARSIDYYDTLKANGLNMLTVSVDSLTQPVADQCRFGTDVGKLLQRMVELYYTFAPNIQFSLVLSRKNADDAFNTFRILNEIAKTGQEPLVVMVQRMIMMSKDLAADYEMRPEDLAVFQDKIRLHEGAFPHLRLGLCGVLQPACAAQSSCVQTSTAQETKGPPLCDKPYYDRYVTLDGELAPCCVLIDGAEWGHTRLDAPLAELLARPAITEWFARYATQGHKGCKACSLMSALPADVAQRVRASCATGSPEPEAA
ncbi:MAG: radical SAM protein [Alphaproteobacteria bacterium]|jgi:MoaA/NifB/PqqE/SkfB family radical SAM enzyme|nr:radical SAM protein [Alphaproteobacteria bacterium]